MPHHAATLLDIDPLITTMQPLSKCAEAPAPLRYTQLVPKSPPNYRLDTLATGARVVSTTLADRPSITMAIMIKVGTRYESDQEAAISHFLEHLLLKGSARYGGPQQIG